MEQNFLKPRGTRDGHKWVPVSHLEHIELHCDDLHSKMNPIFQPSIDNGFLPPNFDHFQMTSGAEIPILIVDKESMATFTILNLRSLATSWSS